LQQIANVLLRSQLLVVYYPLSKSGVLVSPMPMQYGSNELQMVSVISLSISHRWGGSVKQASTYAIYPLGNTLTTVLIGKSHL
jgi:hypothetical protein